jgi:hypothetical protein
VIRRALETAMNRKARADADDDFLSIGQQTHVIPASDIWRGGLRL